MYVILGLETYWNREGRPFRTYEPASHFLFKTKSDAYRYLRMQNLIRRPLTIKQPIVCHESEMPKIVNRKGVRKFYENSRENIPVLEF